MLLTSLDSFEQLLGFRKSELFEIVHWCLQVWIVLNSLWLFNRKRDSSTPLGTARRQYYSTWPDTASGLKSPISRDIQGSMALSEPRQITCIVHKLVVVKVPAGPDSAVIFPGGNPGVV